VFDLKVFATIFHICISLFVIATVMLQPSKAQGLSKTISGGAETFFGKNKGRSYEGKLQKMTEIAMVLFVISSMILVYYSNH
jgi:preprotein translocase subunit SecG